MSAPAFFRYLPPMKRKEIAPLIMLFLAATLIVIFAKVTEELLEGGLHGFDRGIFSRSGTPIIRRTRSARFGSRSPPAM